MPPRERHGGAGEGRVSPMSRRHGHRLRGLLPHQGAGVPQPPGPPPPGRLHLLGGALRALDFGGLSPRHRPHRHRPRGLGVSLRPLPHGRRRLRRGGAGTLLLWGPGGVWGVLSPPGHGGHPKSWGHLHLWGFGGNKISSPPGGAVCHWGGPLLTLGTPNLGDPKPW